MKACFEYTRTHVSNTSAFKRNDIQTTNNKLFDEAFDRKLKTHCKFGLQKIYGVLGHVNNQQTYVRASDRFCDYLESPGTGVEGFYRKRFSKKN